MATVIYDGDCGICNEVRVWAAARDRAGRLAFIPYQAADLESLSPGLTRELTSRMAYFVRPDGTRVGGARAIFETLKRLPGVWGVLGWASANPLISALAEPFYRLVAANRHRISARLGLMVCRVPPGPRRVEMTAPSGDDSSGRPSAIRYQP